MQDATCKHWINISSVYVYKGKYQFWYIDNFLIFCLRVADRKVMPLSETKVITTICMIVSGYWIPVGTQILNNTVRRTSY